MTSPSLNMDRMRHYVELRRQASELDAKLKAAKQEMDGLEPGILDDMTQAGVPQVVCDGVMLYISTTRAASIRDGDTPRAIAALKKLGLGDFVKTAPVIQSVSAWVREEIKDGREIPTAFLEAFNLVELPKLGVRTKT